MVKLTEVERVDMPVGSWRRSRGLVVVACPGCGTAAVNQYAVGEGGRVGSWRCLFPDCEWEGEVELEGWESR